LTAIGSGQAGVILDDAGRAWPSHSLSLARQLGCPTGDFDVIAHAVRRLGYVHVAPLRDALVVKFDPATVHHLAAIAAFYEIAGRAPRRLILACPGEPGCPDRYEIFHSLNLGLRRLEAAADATHKPADARSAPPAAPPGSPDPVGTIKRSGPIGPLWQPDRPVVYAQAGDTSKRLSLPLDAIAPEDAWFGRLLGLWREAQAGWRLPASELLDRYQALNIARGRVHIVETRAADPPGYRFRLWGEAVPYGVGYSNLTLGQMPPGLMRDGAVEDYWAVVTRGMPTYQLIQHAENGMAYSYARLLLPLAADGRQVDQLLVLINARELRELMPL
jgi:hypothetical protein